MSAPPGLDGATAELAAEFALGVLEGDELVRAQGLVAADPAFRAEVDRWSDRLAPLFDEVAPVEPPAGVLGAVQNKIAALDRPSGNVVALRRRVSLWRGVAGVTTALAASLATVLVIRPDAFSPPVVAPAAAPAPLIAMLGDEAGGPRMVASWNPYHRRLMVTVAGETPAAVPGAHELWVIPADGRPRSLGVMPRADTMRMNVGEQLAAQLRAGSTLAISVEPNGGSPTGLPTGPVIASGRLEAA